MELVTREYQGLSVIFNDDGWINATDLAIKHGRRVDHWIANKDTVDYIDALCKMTDTRKVGYVKTSKATLASGGGTWLHPKLAVAFARWLNPMFAIWCDSQIDNIIHGTLDQSKSRIEAANNYKLMQDIVLLTRRDLGKDTKSFHYSNEALLVNEVLTGKRESINRDKLTASELKSLSKLERINAVLFARGLDKDQRKEQLRIALHDMNDKTLEKLTSTKALA